MNFPEENEVQLLLLSSGEVKAVASLGVSVEGFQIEVGNGGLSSKFGTISTADENTSYNSFDSSITGANITYTDPEVIVRYKRTKIVVIQVPSYGFLHFNQDNTVRCSLLQSSEYKAL